MSKKIVIGLITIIAASVFIHTLVNSVFYFNEEEATVATVYEAKPISSVSHELTKPKKLIIPSIEVDAVIQEVGITTKGAMAAPNNFKDAGWYKYGSIPGDIGSAVIDGHVDNGLALAGVFKRLQEVQAGQEIIVEYEVGNKLHFMIDEIASYPYTEVPKEKLFNRRGERYLHLITCGGNFLKDLKTYDERVVVYAHYTYSEEVKVN